MLQCLLLIGLSGASVNSSLDRNALMQLMKASFASFEDLYCEYEGRIYYSQEAGIEGLGPGGLYDVFSGAFLYRRDGAALVDIYHRHRRQSDDQVFRETIAVIAGQSERFQRSVDMPSGGGEVKQAGFREVDIEGSLGRIHCHRLLLGYLRDPAWTMTSEEPESIGGYKCLVVSFHRIAVGQTEPFYSERFWIDLGRGGHPLQREIYIRGGRRISSMEDVVLQKFQDDRGTAVWLPISGVYKSYGHIDEQDELIFNSQPTHLGNYAVLRASIRLNQSIPDERFSVRFRTGTLITDQLRRAQYEFGQARLPETRPLTRAEVEAQLDEQLRIADAQGDELRAASWERGGRGWSAWLPTTLVGSSLVLLIVLLVRRYIV